MFGTETSRWLLSSDPGTGLIIALYVNVPAPATPMTWVCTSLRRRHNKTASARIKVSSQLNNDVNIISSIRRENILILVLALNDMLASLTCIKAYKSWFFVSFLFLLMSWFVSWRLGEDRRSQMLFFFIFPSFETDICLKSLNTLERAGLIKMDDGFDLKPTGGFLIFKLEWSCA